MDSFRGYKTLFKNAPFLLYGFSTAIPIIGTFAYITSSPFLFQDDLGLSPIEYGYLSLIFGAIVIILSLVNVKLLNYFSLDFLINVGGSLIVIAGAFLIFFHFTGTFTFLSLYLPCVVFFCSISLLRTNSTSKTLNQISRNFGSANAVLFTSQMGFAALTSFVFSLIPQNDGLVLGICFLLIGLLNFLIVYFAKKEETKRNKKPKQK